MGQIMRWQTINKSKSSGNNRNDRHLIDPKHQNIVKIKGEYQQNKISTPEKLITAIKKMEEKINDLLEFYRKTTQRKKWQREW